VSGGMGENDQGVMEEAETRDMDNNGTNEIYYINSMYEYSSTEYYIGVLVRGYVLHILHSKYISSEREYEARGPIQVLKSQIARDVLEPRQNYRMLNFYDMTAAFTYDTATQGDGMHIIGPPMKMVRTKLFHYVCVDYLISRSFQR
jgi:hypothetical protein